MTGNSRRLPRIRAGLLIVCIALHAGCGPAGPDVQMIKGVLALDGKPAEGVTVIFTPDGEGLMAAGKTDAAGAFSLNASLGRKFGGGTTVGEYIVTVSKLTAYKIDPSTGEPTDTLLPEPRQLMPRAYTSVYDSPLRASVTEGVNEFQFDLSSKLAK
jgi:hypothetical protein